MVIVFDCHVFLRIFSPGMERGVTRTSGLVVVVVVVVVVVAALLPTTCG